MKLGGRQLVDQLGVFRRLLGGVGDNPAECPDLRPELLLVHHAAPPGSLYAARCTSTSARRPARRRAGQGLAPDIRSGNSRRALADKSEHKTPRRGTAL